MVKELINGIERTYDGYVVQNLTGLKERVKQDWDGLLFIFGREGVGKSTFAAQIGLFLDHNITLDQVCWTAKDFAKLVMTAKPFSCIILDEAYLTFTKKSSKEGLQDIIIALLTMCRKKNLFILIVAPTIFDLNQYLVVHRALAAFRCYAPRGRWELYGDESKLKLYMRGRRDHNLMAARADLRGGFGSWFPFDKEEYERRKDKALDELAKKILRYDTQLLQRDEHLEKIEIQLLARLHVWGQLKPGSFTKYARYMKIPKQTLSDHLAKAKIEAEEELHEIQDIIFSEKQKKAFEKKKKERKIDEIDSELEKIPDIPGKQANLSESGADY